MRTLKQTLARAHVKKSKMEKEDEGLFLLIRIFVWHMSVKFIKSILEIFSCKMP
jgi:hypothetical protein